MKLLLLASCLLLSLAARAADGLPSQPYIYVQGFASRSVTPDSVQISFDISVADENQTKAKDLVKKKSEAVSALFQKLKLPEQDVVNFEMTVRPDRNYKDNRLEFDVSRKYSVRLRKLDAYAELIDGLYTIQVGELRKIEPMTSQEDTIRAELRQAAIADARRKGEELAAKLGTKITKVYAASPTQFSEILRAMFPPDLRTAVGALHDVQFGDVQVFESIHVIYLIE